MNKFRNYVLPAQVVLVVLISALMALCINVIACGFIAAISLYTFAGIQMQDAMQNFTCAVLFISILVTAVWMWSPKDKSEGR